MEAFSFTQCVSVLFARAPALEEISEVLERWPVAGRAKEGEGEEGWALSGPGFVYDVPGGTYAAVDVVDRPWPDELPSSPALGAAWSRGAFGPASSPGALARAIEQPWTWPEGAAAARGQKAFVRFRSGFTVAQSGSEKPAPRDPVFELALLTELAQPFLRRKGALAFFVPAGEALRSPDQIDAALRRKIGSGPPPFELWTNVRSVTLSRENDKTWLCLDVVGLGQLGLPDVDAIFAEGREEPAAVEQLLRNSCLHLVSQRPIAPGSTSDDGKGRRWESSNAFAVVAPRRPVVRWVPQGGPKPPKAMLARLGAKSAPAPPDR